MYDNNHPGAIPLKGDPLTPRERAERLVAAGQERVYLARLSLRDAEDNLTQALIVLDEVAG